MVRVGNELRKEFGAGHFATQLLRKIERDTSSRFVVIDELVNPGEIEIFRRLPWFFLLGIDTPREERWMSEQASWPSLHEFEVWDREFGGEHQPPWGLQIDACMKLVDEMSSASPQKALLISHSNVLGRASLYVEIDRFVGKIEWQIGERI